MSVVGFDFGYQSCYIAVARQGGIETITNEYSDRSTPTVVSLCEKNRQMGMAAQNMMISNMKNTLWGFKKLIGRKYSDPVVQSEKQLLPYEVLEGPDGNAAVRCSYLSEQSTFSPGQVTTMMFTKLKEIAETNLKIKVNDCVISVPCYWTDIERRTLLDSAAAAGLNVLRLMNDTTATALAYGIYKQDLPVPEEKPRNVVFVDVGHCDTQVAVCAFHKGKLKVLSTAADSNLGGRNFDLLLRDHFATDFKARYKVDALQNKKAFLRLLNECQKTKKLMSANATPIPLNIECFMDDKDVSGKMTRGDLEELATDIVARFENICRTALESSGLKQDDIYSIEIVGGSTRVPMIKQAVTKVYGKTPSTTLNADEAVARGCALQCAILSPIFRVRDFSITDCQAYPITLSWQGALPDEESEMEVFSKFHQVPFSKLLTFYRKAAFVLDAKYSSPEGIPYPSPYIGQFKIDNVVPQANGEASKVKIKVRVNINGVFNVSSATMIEKLEPQEGETDEPMEVEGEKTEPTENGPQVTNSASTTEADKPAENANAGSGDQKDEEPMQTDQPEGEAKSEAKKEEKKEGDKKESPKKPKNKVKTIDLNITANVATLNKTELNLLQEKECQMIAQDRLEKEKADAKNAVEEYVYEMRDKLSGALEEFVQESDRDEFRQKLTQTEDWLYDDGEDQSKKVYTDKLADLKKIGQPIADRCREKRDRPKAFEEIGASLQKVRKVYDLVLAKDEKYDHLEKADTEKLEKAIRETQAWFDKSLNSSTQLKPYENPSVLCSQILQMKQTFENLCNPIINKPKPKPKEEPPKDKKEGTPTPPTNGAEQNAKPEEAAPTTEPAQESQQPPSTEDKADMELD